MVLVDIALLFCPREFREGYRMTMRRDVLAGRSTFLEACNIVGTGVQLHLENIWREVAYAARTLAAARLFTCVAICTIALAIGANVAVASVLNGILLQPLPYANAQRLVFVNDGLAGQISYANATAVAKSAQTITDLAIGHGDRTSIQVSGRLVNIAGSEISPNYFRVLGERIELGRTLKDSDVLTRRVIISDRLWRRYFSADPRVIGRALRLGPSQWQVVGVAPRYFRDPTTSGLEVRDYWRLPNANAGYMLNRANDTFDAIARIRDGVSLESVRADVRRVLRLPLSGASTFADVIVGPVRTLLWLLYGAVIVLLAIACGNVANLALVRTAGRESEISVRAALGASLRRIAMQFSTEAALLALAGGAIGVIAGNAALHGFDALGSQLLPRWDQVRIDGRVALYATVLVVIATLVTGLLPVLMQRGDVSRGLKRTGRSGAHGAARRVRDALVIGEIALAVLVAISAGLLFRSFSTLIRVDLGFDGSDTSYVSFEPPDGLTDSQTLLALRPVVDSVSRVPGVSEVALTGPVPYTYDHYSPLTIPGRRLTRERVLDDEVSTGFFHLMRIPLYRGRDFSSRDVLSSEPVAIVDAAFARRYFGSLDVVGQTITPQRASEPDAGPAAPIVSRRIIGVVGDTRRSLTAGIAPTVYLPTSQIPIINNLIVRTSGDSQSNTRNIIAAFAAADARIPQPQVDRFEDIVASDVAESAASARLFGALSAVALLLALAGIYAVTAESVTQRMHEFGIRKAIGAHGGDILRDVLATALRQSAIGILIGLILTAIGSRFLASLLFETSPLDPVAFSSVVAVVVACTLLAAAIPAIRATRVEPSATLRYE